MTRWRRFVVAAVGALAVVGAGTVTASAEGGSLIEFESMTPVTGTAVGTVNDRGIKGGGLPWAIKEGRGEVDRHGNLEIEVKGLVIPVPPLNGKNPIPFFSATLSCLTPHGVVNITTGPFTATVPGGDSTIETRIRPPHPCKRPQVFVGFTTPTGVFVWFARSNVEDDD